MTLYRDDDGTRLPIKLDSTSNGEFAPVPLAPAARRANRLAQDRATEIARRLAQTRRRFLVSASGAAATLLAMNEAFAAAGSRGGFYGIPRDAAYEPELAAAAVGGDEFIFDVQGHHVNPAGAWRTRPGAERWEQGLKGFPQASLCGNGDAVIDKVFDHMDCFSAQHYVKEIFLDSDTDMGVLSFVPSRPEDEPLTIEDAAATRDIVDALEGSKRLLLHGRVAPNIPGDIDRMTELAETWKISAWKTYTQFGPGGTGYWLDDPKTGIPFIERAREIGVKVICVHKGLPLFGMDYAHSTCRDIGAVAKMYPDVTFIVYHSGFETSVEEGPYDPLDPKGIDSLVKALDDYEIPPGANVYAELGSTWRFLMRDPDQAAHGLGKLLTRLGEDRVLWGTDSIWYGSPQDQIQAFRTFQISEEYQEKYGYPALTPALRAKVFGLNAAGPYGVRPDEVKTHMAADAISGMRRAYAEGPEPGFLTYGPKTRREFFRYLRLAGGPA